MCRLNGLGWIDWKEIGGFFLVKFEDFLVFNGIWNVVMCFWNVVIFWLGFWYCVG